MTTAPTPTSNSYIETLGQMRHGTLLDDLANAQALLLHAVRETGKPGKLIVELIVAPEKGQTGAVRVSDKVTLKAPEADVADTLAFITAEGDRLTRRDPRQAELPTGPTAVAREEQEQTG